MAGTSGSTKQVWVLLEQDSIYGRLRRLKYSLHDYHNQYTSTNRQNHHSSYLIMPYRTQPSRRGTRDKLVSTQDRDFPGFLPVGMKGIRGCLLSQAYPFPTAKNLHYALMRMIVSSHKITNAPCQGGVVTVSNNTQKYYARVQNACLQEYARGCTFWKLLSFFKNPILRKFKLTHNFKTVQKSCLENFQIDTKIN